MIEKKEFDSYIKNYRTNNDNALWLSGEPSNFFAQYKAKKIKEWLPELDKKQDKKILDFGCGDGLMTNYVGQVFSKAELYGVDPSPKSIQRAQENFSHIHFSTNSDQSKELNYADNTFDLIFSAGTFHHIPFDQHKGYLQELKRITKSDGHIIIFELNPLNPLTFYTFKNNPIDKDAKMLTPWYAHRLAKTYTKPTLKFYCFFPKMFNCLRGLEKYLTWLPIGALYAVIISSNKK